MKMKNMRCLFLILALGFSLGAPRAQGQTASQVMTFSLVCQYVTNFVTVTNQTTGDVTYYSQLETVVVNTANIAKAIAIQKFGTNWSLWSPADIFYQVNMTNGASGIYLGKENKYTNISDLFGSSLTNFFSQNVDTVFTGTNYASSLPLGGNLNDESPAMFTNINRFANLASVTFGTSNFSFSLFGYSQGNLTHATGYLDGQLYQYYLPVGQITGAGTFSLNLTTNVFLVPTTNGTPTNYAGIAHGTIYLGAARFLTNAPPYGP